MTLGHLILIVAGVLFVYGLAAGKFYQRVDNGHWRAARAFETPYYAAAGVAILHAYVFLVALFGLGVLTLFAITIFQMPIIR